MRDCVPHPQYRPNILNIPDDQSKNVVSNTLYAGHYGVHLFFVISGFILSLPFAKQYLIKDAPQHPAARLLSQAIDPDRTALRYPINRHVLLCALVLRNLPTHPRLYHNPDWARYASSHIFASLFYSNGLSFGAHPYPNFVLWSLEVEVQFYLVAPSSPTFSIFPARVCGGRSLSARLSRRRSF